MELLKFPGWKSGEYKAICWIGCSIDELASIYGVKPIMTDVSHYFWGVDDCIGNYVFGSESSETEEISQIFVDLECTRLAGFKFVVNEVVGRLPLQVPIYIEDDTDIERRLEILEMITQRL